MTRSALRRTGLLAALVVAFSLLVVLVVTDWDPLHRLDLRVAANLHDIAVQNPGQVTFWDWVSRVLHPDVERIVAAIVALALWLKGYRGVAVFIVVTMVGAALLESLVKLAVGRDRPVFTDPVAHGASASFPSGHALTAVVAFGLLVLLVPRRYLIAAAVVGVLAAALVSYSRLALGVHYLSDVLGAWLLGAAWLVAAATLLPIRWSADSERGRVEAGLDDPSGSGVDRDRG